MFSKAFLVSALAALATAQSSVLTFTRVPNPITDGQPAAITYATNDTSSPVTIILRKGSSGNLQTVSTLTTSATDGQFIWTPPLSLPNGIDYALQITQGSQSNYYGPFAIQGASASASSYPSSASLTTSVSTSSNTTITTTAVAPIGTAGTVGIVSAATGTALHRNTTLSRATLTASSTGSSTASASATDSGASFQGTETSSGSSASSTSESSASIHLGSSIALFGAIAAAVFMQ